MKRWFIDKILPAIVTGLVVAAANLYVDVQVLKKMEATHAREIEVLRAELTDLWAQANDAVGR